MTRLVVGLDIGTSSYKAAAFDGSGRQVGEASAVPSHVHPQPGWAEQDPADLMTTVALSLRRMVEAGIEPNDVEAIGLTGQLGGMVLVDAAGSAIGVHEVWLDNRATPQREALLHDYGTEILESTGIHPFQAPRILWRSAHAPDELRRAAKAVQSWPFVGMTLAGLGGEAGYNDATSIGTFGLADAQHGRWSEQLSVAIGINSALLPRVVEPWDVVGELTDLWARRTGLRAGTPIVAGLGDGIAGWLGCGAIEPGIAVDTVGSSDHLGIAVDRFVADSKQQVLSTFRSAVPGVWHLFGFTAGSGLSHQWFRREFGGKAQENDEGWASLEAEAVSIAPGSEGMICIPHLEGRFCPDQPDVRGVFHGFTWQHTRAHFYRSILESIAFEYAHYLDAVKRLGIDTAIQSARVVGGGAKSALWNQIKSDVLGIEYQQLEPSNYTCRGAALCAGIASGLYSDLPSAATDGLTVARCFEPNPDYNRCYQPFVAHYQALLAELQPSFSRSAALG